MRIAFFVDSLPPNTDGVSHTFSQLVKTLDSELIDYRFFSPFKPNKTIPWNVRVRDIAYIPFPFYPAYRIGLPMFENLYNDLDEFQPDLIHATSPTPLGIVGLNYAESHNLPVVSSYHTHFVHYFHYYGFRLLENLGWTYLRWFHNRSLLTLAPTDNVAKELLKKGFREVDIWSRGINLELFSPKRYNTELRQKIAQKDEPILLFVGRLVKEKNLEDLVIASQILKSWKKKFKLLIVGDGPMRTELEKKLPDAHFTGYQHGQNLAKLYATSDVFVFPSTTETFGNVVLEAFASGLPVVCVNKGGVVDLVKDEKTGLIAEPYNPYSIAKNTLLLLENESLRNTLVNNALKEAQLRSWNAINLRLLDNYRRILNNPKLTDKVKKR